MTFSGFYTQLLKLRSFYVFPNLYSNEDMILALAGQFKQVRGSYLHLISNTALHITFLSYLICMLYALRTLSAICFFPSDKLFYFYFYKFRRIICTIFLCNKNYIGHHARLRGNDHRTCWSFLLIENVPPCPRKQRLFLHFQRFQNFRSAVLSFFATNFHLFFPTMPFETPIFLACELPARKAAIILCYYAQCKMRSAILRNHLKEKIFLKKETKKSVWGPPCCFRSKEGEINRPLSQRD